MEIWNLVKKNMPKPAKWQINCDLGGVSNGHGSLLRNIMSAVSSPEADTHLCALLDTSVKLFSAFLVKDFCVTSRR